MRSLLFSHARVNVSALVLCLCSRLVLECCLIHGDAHAGNMLWDGAQQRLTLIDVPTMLAATRVERVTEAQPANVQGKFRVQVGGGPARLSAACPHPSAAEALLLSGCALSARDVCHFERKLDSHASRRGVDPSEVAQMQSEFTRTYLGAGGAARSPTPLDDSFDCAASWEKSHSSSSTNQWG